MKSGLDAQHQLLDLTSADVLYCLSVSQFFGPSAGRDLLLAIFCQQVAVCYKRVPKEEQVFLFLIATTKDKLEM